MKDETLNHIISIVRNYIAEEGMGVGAIANATNPPDKINLAGLPPDTPPVDLRKGKRRNWNPFFKELARVQRRKPPQ